MNMKGKTKARKKTILIIVVETERVAVSMASSSSSGLKVYGLGVDDSEPKVCLIFSLSATDNTSEHVLIKARAGINPARTFLRIRSQKLHAKEPHGTRNVQTVHYQKVT
jgi:hypothetical protein